MSASASITETAGQIDSLNISEELQAKTSGTTLIVRREDECRYHLTRMGDYLIDAVVELSNVSAAEAAATMRTLISKAPS